MKTLFILIALFINSLSFAYEQVNDETSLKQFPKMWLKLECSYKKKDLNILLINEDKLDTNYVYFGNRYIYDKSIKEDESKFTFHFKTRTLFWKYKKFKSITINKEDIKFNEKFEAVDNKGRVSSCKAYNYSYQKKVGRLISVINYQINWRKNTESLEQDCNTLNHLIEAEDFLNIDPKKKNYFKYFYTLYCEEE